MEVDFTGSFWNSENMEDKEIGIIIDEGKLEKKTNPTTQQQYTIFNITVEAKGKQKLFSPSREAGLAIAKAFTNDSKKWIGRKLQFYHVIKSSFGKQKTYLEAKPLV